MLGGENSRVWEEIRPGEKRSGGEKTGNLGKLQGLLTGFFFRERGRRWTLGERGK
ncbi:hypothetical protein DPMN_136603 [Dreissena polymorpha]|uniref:Uncharacterized protein n=1 Tax=Dreissena polymorpha TaxID=45954 RepID=A0A9D4JDX9_DREPO|nr:hypothetical protein DPMN_136603 [Dreissena polymorpha]